MGIRNWELGIGKFFILMLIVSSFFGGCSKKDFTKEPAKMHWDRDMCERCKMAISERNFAVQAIDNKNRVYKFDDIGCFILWHEREHPEIKIVKIWIKDIKTGKWIDAKEAKYVQKYISPMGYGFGAMLPSEAPKGAMDFEQMKKEMEKIGR